MGDRANFGFRASKDEPVLYLYGHWAGDGMMNTLAHALEAASSRILMGDSAYATRIAISNIIGDSWRSETGWGLTINYLADNEHSVPIVDFDTSTVSLYPAPDWGTGLKPDETQPKFTMTIESFIAKFAKHLAYN